jgi:hypothetical protein
MGEFRCGVMRKPYHCGTGQFPQSARAHTGKAVRRSYSACGFVFSSTIEPFGDYQDLPLSREDAYPGKLRPPAECRWRFFLTGSDHERSGYQSFSLAGSSRYVGSITFRDQLDWPGAARVLVATDFRRSECATTNAPVKIRTSIAKPDDARAD